MHASVISTKKSSDHNTGEDPRRRNLRTMWVNQGCNGRNVGVCMSSGDVGLHTLALLSNAEVICWSYRVLTVVKIIVSANLHCKNQVRGANTIDLQPSRLVFESTPELPMHGAGVTWLSPTIVAGYASDPSPSQLWAECGSVAYFQNESPNEELAIVYVRFTHIGITLSIISLIGIICTDKFTNLTTKQISSRLKRWKLAACEWSQTIGCTRRR